MEHLFGRRQGTVPHLLSHADEEAFGFQPDAVQSGHALLPRQLQAEPQDTRRQADIAGGGASAIPVTTLDTVARSCWN